MRTIGHCPVPIIIFCRLDLALPLTSIAAAFIPAETSFVDANNRFLGSSGSKISVQQLYAECRQLGSDEIVPEFR
jgi:hypothetical protein